MTERPHEYYKQHTGNIRYIRVHIYMYDQHSTNFRVQTDLKTKVHHICALITFRFEKIQTMVSQRFTLWTGGRKPKVSYCIPLWEKQKHTTNKYFFKIAFSISL